MAFGPIMKLTTESGLKLELAPFTREEVLVFIAGLQKQSTNQYNGMLPVTAEMEQEWFDKRSKESNVMLWGVWVVERDKKKLIGYTEINEISPLVPTQRNITQGSTSITLTDNSYWHRGVASAAHYARTWYAFEQLGLVRLRSAVAQENTASRRALDKVGYSHVYVERNFQFIDGHYVHEDMLECLNPADWAWRLWWGDDRPSRKNLQARKKTEAALAWSREHIVLP